MATYEVWVKRTQELCQTVTADNEEEAIALAQELGEWEQPDGTEEEFNAHEEVCEDCSNDTDMPCTACLWEESVK
jgi:hypothetical protein